MRVARLSSIPVLTIKTAVASRITVAQRVQLAVGCVNHHMNRIRRATSQTCGHTAAKNPALLIGWP